MCQALNKTQALHHHEHLPCAGRTTVVTGEAVVAVSRLQDTRHCPMHFVPSLHSSLPLYNGASTPGPSLHLKTGGKGMWLLLGSGWKQRQVRHHLGFRVQMPTELRARHRQLHAAHCQAESSFLKGTEWHISMLAI